MIKAVFFDMDGVITDSAKLFVKNGVDDMLINMFGKDLWQQYFSKANGLSLKRMYDLAIANGAKYSYEKYNYEWNNLAKLVYGKSTISPGLEDLIDWLNTQNIKVGIVSSSPIEWIDSFTSRLRNNHKINGLYSVNDHPTLLSKPAPDPYLHAMMEMEVKPHEAIVLEDTAVGVMAGKNSGAYTICFTAYHLDKQPPIEADAYAEKMSDVQILVEILL